MRTKIARNAFGVLESYSGGYRIIRDGDWIPSHKHGNLNTIRNHFDRLGARAREMKHLKRITVGEFLLDL